jgi:hypothetical protein
MKKLVLFIVAITYFVSAKAQGENALHINNQLIRVTPTGMLYNDSWDLHTLSYGNLWIGGIDASSTLKIAANTYGIGADFFPGPLNSVASTDSTIMANFNRVWKIDQCAINAYTSWLSFGMPGPNPVDSVSMEAIINWPSVNPDGSPLASFNDLNSNGIYEPLAGEVPIIKGDEAIFFVCNDRGGLHTETGGASIGIEIQGMIYEYSCSSDSSLFNTFFENYKIINKSSFRLDSVFVGNWSELDIGSPYDDFIGCDVSRGTYYGYNGDSIDDMPPAGMQAYGTNPPALGVVFLAGPYADPNGIDDPASATPNGTNYGDGIIDNERLGMSKFHYYNNDLSSIGSPSSPPEFYNYMAGAWKDGTPMMYGGIGHLSGGVPCDYMYPGNSDPSGFGTIGSPQPIWDEQTAGNIPGDRRGLGVFGPLTFQPGAINDITYAYVFAKATSGGNLASVALLQDRIDSVRQKFNSSIVGCGCSTISACHASFNIVQDTSNLFNYWVYNTSSMSGTTSYLWDFGDGTTSTLAYPSHTYAAASPVYLCLTVTNGTCSDTYCDSIHPGHASGTFTINVLPAGIHEQTNNISSLDVYPNPASENININYTSTSKNYSIKIYDAVGSLVKEVETAKIISIADLKNGIYLLNIYDGKTSSTKRFIKQ